MKKCTLTKFIKKINRSQDNVLRSFKWSQRVTILIVNTGSKCLVIPRKGQNGTKRFMYRLQLLTPCWFEMYKFKPLGLLNKIYGENDSQRIAKSLVSIQLNDILKSFLRMSRHNFRRRKTGKEEVTGKRSLIKKWINKLSQEIVGKRESEKVHREVGRERTIVQKLQACKQRRLQKFR